MTKEILDTTNKLVTPESISASDNESIRQLSENLQNITPDDVDAMCNENTEAPKKEKENGGFEPICEVDGSDVEYNESKRIVRWKGDMYDLNTFLGIRKFLDSISKFTNEDQYLVICTKIGI